MAAHEFWVTQEAEADTGLKSLPFLEKESYLKKKNPSLAFCYVDNSGKYTKLEEDISVAVLRCSVFSR